METNLKFNSAICTSREQSERLLALGLKKETADIVIRPDNTLIIINENSFIYHNLEKAIQEDYFPAWSLHRLIELCGNERLPISFGKKGKVRIRVSHIHPTHDGRSGYNHYDSLTDCIEWLITESYFNKEYLEE
jgi:hypothetical protein